MAAAATHGQTQLVAPLPPTHTPTGKFTPDRFQLSEDDMTLICPNEQTTTLAYRSGSGAGRLFRFLGLQCRDCPVWLGLWKKIIIPFSPRNTANQGANWDNYLFPCPLLCRTHQPGSKRIRQVFISDYRREVEAAQRYNATEAFRLEMKQRPRIERIIAALVRYNGARDARRRGKLKCDFQAKMNAVAYNLKKWMRLLRTRNAQAASP